MLKLYNFLNESLIPLQESTQTPHFIYHYERNGDVCNKILKSGHLISASFIGNEDGKYKERSKKYNNNVDNYFRDRYDNIYKQVLKKNYEGDYGIYFSPSNCFNFDLPLHFFQRFRFKLDIKTLLSKGYDIIWSVRKLGPQKKKIIKKINSYSDYISLYNYYLDNIESEEKEVKLACEDFIKHKKLLFLRLPQIVVFAGKDGIPVKNSNLERKL